MSKNTMYGWILVKILVILSFVGMIAANTAAVVLPLNDISTKEVSDLYTNLFTPAPYTFSIWAVIYLALAGFVIYQISPPRRGKGILTPSDLLRIQFAFIFSCIINFLWIFSWPYLKLILWAYGGILNNHLSASGFGGHYYSIMIANVTCMVVMLVVAVTRSLYRE